MTKFIIGIFLGAALAAGYVHFNWQLPLALQVPDRLKGNLISSATEGELYNLRGDPEMRRRALEVYFANRAPDAARLDAEAGHPFLSALVAERARREARQLVALEQGADMALSKPALRESLERKHATADIEALKRAMLMDALDERPFLRSWLETYEGPVTAERLPATLRKVARLPQR